METLQPFSASAKSLKVGIYEHYSGKRFQLLAVARHSESLEELVVYQALYGEGNIWVRPLAMFVENIIMDGREKPRFRCCSVEEAPL